jgi:hypothetical protein
MNRIFLLLVCISITTVLNAQVFKTVDITEGNLSTALTSTELNEVTNLTITGTIDARDFKTMRDDMPALAVIDISSVEIKAYSGTEGTYFSGFYYDFQANLIPEFAFYNPDNGISKSGLTSVIFPLTVKIIGYQAFVNCSGLTSATLPSSVTTIEDFVFYGCTGLTTVTIPISVNFIGEFAFYFCTNITSIISETVNPVDLSSSLSVFDGVDKNTCELFVSYQSKVLYEVANQWSDFTKISEMPGFRLSTSVVSLPETANTTSVDISSNVSWTANYASDWLSVNPLSGSSGTNSIILDAEANPAVAIRSVSVVISSPGVVSQTITVTQAGLPKTLAVTAGGLFSALSGTELNTVTKLILTGSIDASDFKTMRDDMPELAEIDLSGVIIESYSGLNGTYYAGDVYDYPANMIPEFAFYNPDTYVSKTGLTSVILPFSVISFGQFCFFNCYGLTSLNIPSSVTNIGDYVFFECSGLTSITIPASVANIGEYAFGNCVGLTSIYTQKENPIDLSSSTGVFDGVNVTTCKLYVPFQSKVLYEVAPQWQDFTDIQELPGFKLSTSAVSVPETASESLVEITADVTWDASSDQIWLDVSPTSNIGNGTLQLNAEANPLVATRTAIVTISSPGVDSQTITITQSGLPKTVNIFTSGTLSTVLTPEELNTITRLVLTGTIDARDFKTMRDEMPELTEIDISGVTIAPYSGTEGTVAAYFDYLINSIPDFAFNNQSSGIGKTSLTSIKLPSSAFDIGIAAFAQCVGLTLVTIPSSFTTISESAFFGCAGLTEITIPSSVTSIRSYAFGGCSNLISVDLPSSLISVETGIFYYCTGLNSVTIPSSIISIEENAFEGCFTLTSVTIPKSVISIGSNAFYDCASLASIFNNALVPQDLSTSPDVFYGVNKTTCRLYVPAGTSALYAAANQWQDFNIISEASTQLNYRLTNPGIKNVSGSDYFEFEVQVKANESGTYFWDGNISLDFNSTTLSSNPADWAVTISSPFNAINSLTNPKYSTIVSVAGSKINVQFSGDVNAINNPASGIDFVEITTGYQTMVTISAKILESTGKAGIDFNEASMNGQQYNKLSVNPWYGVYTSPNLYDAADFMDTYVGRIYTGLLWTQAGGLDWSANVNTSVWDGNATLPVGLANAGNLRIYSPATLTIPPTSQITVTGTTEINTPEGLVIESDGSGTGSLITGTASGTARVQRWMTTGAWHQVAPPVAGQSVPAFLTGNANVATNGSNRAMMNYITSNNTWSAFYTNGSAGTFAACQGYMMRTGADAAVDFKGNLSSGSQTLTLNGAGDTGWNLIGNPYTSAIDINSGSNDFLTTNTAGLDPGSVGVYVWNQGKNKYDVINFATDVDVASLGQAFFVKSVVDGATVTFNPVMQLHSAAPLKSTKGSSPEIKLIAASNGVNASTDIKFISGTSKGLDPGYDAGLFSLGATFSLYTKLVEDNKGNFMLQCLPAGDFNNLVIPIGINSKAGGKVVFTAELKNLPPDCLVILEDRLNNTFTDLSNKEYSTTVEANNPSTGRFYIHTSYTTTGIDDAGNTTYGLKVYALHSEGIRIEGTVSSQSVATLYDLQGRAVFVNNLEGGNLNIIRTSGIKTGIYMLQINDRKRMQGFKIQVIE